MIFKHILKTHLLAMCFLLVAARASAQSQTLTTTTYSVYFESDEWSLSGEANKTLAQLAAVCASFNSPSIEVAAFADADGSSDYNLRLSERRAKAVIDFLQKKGIAGKYLKADAQGEIGSEEDADKSKNRRVDILVRHLVAPIDPAKTPLALAFAKISKENEQYFTQKPTEEMVINGKNGTLIQIDSGTLQFADGTKPTRAIKFTLREAYNYSSMIENALITASDDQQLETGGMVYIAAESDGKPLELVKGKTMNLQMPLLSALENNKGMELFYGETHGSNIGNNDANTAAKPAHVNWKPSKQKIKLRNKFAKRVKWDYFKKPLLPVVNYSPIWLPTFYAPSQPPHFPRKPANPALAKRSFLEKIAKSDADLEREWNQNWEKKLTAYEEKLEKYKTDSIEYYNVYLPKYKKDLADFYVKLNEREQAYRRYAAAFARYDANRFLRDQMRFVEPFAGKNAEAYTAWFTYGVNFRGLMGSMPDKKEVVFEFDVQSGSNSLAHRFGIPKNCFDTLKAYKKGEFNDIDAMAVKGVDETPYRRDNYDYLVALSSRQIAKEHGIDSLFGKIKKYIAIGKAAADASRAAAQAAYLRTVGDTTLNKAVMKGMESRQLGWINCDRFYSDPSPKTVLAVNETAEQMRVNMFVVFKDIKSIMRLWKVDEKYFSPKIPINKNVIIVSIKTEGDKILVAKQSVTTSDETIVNLDYKPVTLADMKAALAGID